MFAVIALTSISGSTQRLAVPLWRKTQSGTRPQIPLGFQPLSANSQLDLLLFFTCLTTDTHMTCQLSPPFQGSASRCRELKTKA